MAKTKIPEFKFKQSLTKFLTDEKCSTLYEFLKEPKSWTEIKKKLKISDTELGRILDIAKKENLIIKISDKYQKSNIDLIELASKDILIYSLLKTDTKYQNYKESFFLSGAEYKEIDDYILTKCRKIKKFHEEIKEHLFKKRKKKFDTFFNKGLKKINNKNSLIFLKANRSIIYKSLYGYNSLYKRGVDLFFLTMFRVESFFSNSIRKDLLLEDNVKIDAFNLIYFLMDNIVYPQIFVLPNTKEFAQTKRKKEEKSKDITKNLIKFFQDNSNKLGN